MILIRLLLIALAALLHTTGTSPVRADRLGVTFMNSAQVAADETRYQAALATGAGWNRWPLYWAEVEPSPGEWEWSAYDRVVVGDLVHGLQTDVILLSVPPVYQHPAEGGGVPMNLFAPIFSDGTDTPGAGKTINPANHWATFTYTAARRYMPGGELGAMLRLPADAGIRVWEVWNEPDLASFWSGGVANYARLLKVACLAIRYADPDARIVFGGLALVDSQDWLTESLEIIAGDPGRDLHGWYFDVVAIHHYSYAYGTWEAVRSVQQTLHDFGLDRPVWVNESGVPVWDDYPGPTWAADEEADAWRLLRATQEEQAAYVVQSAVYAFAAGAERFFYHQLYDDCGNQPAGTDFAPHDGALCDTVTWCIGDAYGLYRNVAGSVCFGQHPQPNTPRPAFYAFQLLAQVFGAAPFALDTFEDGSAGGVVRVTFTRPQTGERVLVTWNRASEDVTIDVPAAGAEATRYDVFGNAAVMTPNQGAYHLHLQAATNLAVPTLPERAPYAIGGSPYILVETPSP